MKKDNIGNREIKFRAWNKDQQDMTYQFEWSISHSGCPMDIMSIIGREFTLMQYTGLKDKKGKEIYEGDIVDDMWFEIRGGGTVLRFLPKSGRTGKAMKECAPQEYPYFNFEMVEGEYQYVSLEVIGNVFENPELLK